MEDSDVVLCLLARILVRAGLGWTLLWCVHYALWCIHFLVDSWSQLHQYIVNRMMMLWLRAYVEALSAGYTRRASFIWMLRPVVYVFRDWTDLQMQFAAWVGLNFKPCQGRCKQGQAHLESGLAQI